MYTGEYAHSRPPARETCARPAARRLALALVVLVAAAGTGTASAFSDDLAARRAGVMERLGPEAMLILSSAPIVRDSPGVDSEYRQDSNLYYLTGMTQAGTTLVLMPGNDTRREILFIQERNPAQEHWTGRRLGADEARRATGDRDRIAGRSVRAVRRRPARAARLRPGQPTEAQRFFGALFGGARPPRPSSSMPTAPSDDPLRRQRSRSPDACASDLSGSRSWMSRGCWPMLGWSRPPTNADSWSKSFEVSNDAQLAGMRAARPGAYEYEVKAAIEAVHRGRGARPSYPSIVGSGPNATILHYPESDRQMQAGELLLVDAACSLDSMSGDITRTYPVSGRFSPEQTEIYQLVLRAQDAGIAAAQRVARRWRTCTARTVEVMKAGLVKLGLITDANGDQYRMLVHARRRRITSGSTCTTSASAQPSARAGHGVHD